MPSIILNEVVLRMSAAFFFLLLPMIKIGLQRHLKAKRMPFAVPSVLGAGGPSVTVAVDYCQR